jgi:hypothetical protein
MTTSLPAWEAHLLQGQHRKPVLTDPSRGLAPAWATNRIDLIESVPYFRQAQAGIYQHDKTLLGALVDGFSGDHAYFDDEIVITKLDGGGDFCKDPDMRNPSTRLEAARRSMGEGRSVGLIIGWLLLPVLDFFGWPCS